MIAPDIDPPALARRASKYAAAGFVALGGAWAVVFRDIPQWYIAILLFIAFKVVFKYEKCTLSYIEVKARGVKKEEGVLYNFLSGFQDIRGEPRLFYALAAYTAVVSVAYFVALGKSILI
jgi:hypothetical protein